MPALPAWLAGLAALEEEDSGTWRSLSLAQCLGTCPPHLCVRRLQVGKIVASAEESASFWQQKDYKSFGPNTDWHNVDWSAGGWAGGWVGGWLAGWPSPRCARLRCCCC